MPESVRQSPGPGSSGSSGSGGSSGGSVSSGRQGGRAATGPLVHLVAGGIAGATAAVMTCPLEVVKTRLQGHSSAQMRRNLAQASARDGGLLAGRATWPAALRTILREDGMRGLYRGMGAHVMGVFPSRAMYFSAYSQAKRSLAPMLGGQDASMTHVVSASAAGILTATATNPIWLIKTRLQLQSADTPYRYRNTFDAVRQIWRTEGFRGYYHGLTASYVGVSESAVHFMLYERLRLHFAHQGDGDIDPRTAFALAAVSKLCASALTYPHEVVRTRLREQTLTRDGLRRYRSFPHCFRCILVEEGARALYLGMGAHLARVVPNSAIMFMTYEAITTALS